MIVEVSKGNQITIPAEIRNDLNLETGSKLEITKRNGELVLKPIGDDLEKVFAESDDIKPKWSDR